MDEHERTFVSSILCFIAALLVLGAPMRAEGTIQVVNASGSTWFLYADARNDRVRIFERGESHVQGLKDRKGFYRLRAGETLLVAHRVKEPGTVILSLFASHGGRPARPIPVRLSFLGSPTVTLVPSPDQPPPENVLTRGDTVTLLGGPEGDPRAHGARADRKPGPSPDPKGGRPPLPAPGPVPPPAAPGSVPAAPAGVGAPAYGPHLRTFALVNQSDQAWTIALQVAPGATDRGLWRVSRRDGHTKRVRRRVEILLPVEYTYRVPAHARRLVPVADTDPPVVVPLWDTAGRNPHGAAVVLDSAGAASPVLRHHGGAPAQAGFDRTLTITHDTVTLNLPAWDPALLP